VVRRVGSRQHRFPRWLAQVGLYVLTVWAVLTLNFLLPRVMPGDPIAALQDPASTRYLADPDARARLAAYYGLDRPLIEQYRRYLIGVAAWDLGWSIRLNAPVAELIGTHLPWTLLLTVPSLLIASAISILAGTHAGWVRGSAADRGLLVAFTALHTLPVFFVGVLALLLFGVRLGWFPLAGSTTPFRSGVTAWWRVGDIVRHWALPAATLTTELLGARFLLMRNSMVATLGEDYMLVARAKGLPERAVKYRHGLRNAILPFVTALSAQLGFAVAGAIFIETLFAYPGMGRLMFEAVGARDYPVLEGVFLVIALSVLSINLLTDLAYGRLDPRARTP